MLEHGHAPYVETVPFRIIFAFTLLQLVGLGAVYGITKAGVCFLNPKPCNSILQMHSQSVTKPILENVPLGLEGSLCTLQIVGVIFPVFIMALVPFRQFIMPRLFKREHLRELDAAPYEEVGYCIGN